MNCEWLIQWTLVTVSLTGVRSRETFNTLPPPIKTSFTCAGRNTGFYADREMNCRIYHMCDDHNNKFTYYCPEDTAFRQEASICDHAHLVECHKDANNSITSIENSASSEFPDARGDDSRHTYTRSFHINSKPQKPVQLRNKYATFSLSSSIFLRDPKRNGPTTINSKSDNSETTRRNNFVPRSTVRSQSTSTIKTTPRPILKNDKIETDKRQKAFPGFPGIDLLFLQPPPIRTDNNYATEESSTKKLPNPATVNAGFIKRFDSSLSSSFASSSETVKNYTNDKIRNIQVFLEPPKLDSAPSLKARNSNYAYMETLRSMQEGRFTSSTPPPTTTTTTKSPPPSIPPSKLPVVIFTSPLKPLIPNKLEYDPYYPYYPTTTEVYYTPRDSPKARKAFPKSTRKDFTVPKLEIPTVLPDLNSLEDLVDRKKLFFIPSTNFT